MDVVRPTAEGHAIAEIGMGRHRVAQRLLVDDFGLGWAEAHEVADGGTT